LFEFKAINFLLYFLSNEHISASTTLICDVLVLVEVIKVVYLLLASVILVVVVAIMLLVNLWQ